MMLLVTYDVDITSEKGASRLRKVAKICEKYGVRVQNSVFEMIVDPAQVTALKAAISKVMDTGSDSVRLYYLGKHWERKVEKLGVEKGFDQEGTMIL